MENQKTALKAQIIHAFTGHAKTGFAVSGNYANGNPAAVVFLEDWLSDSALLCMSQQLAQPVTAFLVECAEGYHIRWFSVDAEINLCGHGSLAAAACIFESSPENSVTLFSPHGTVVIHCDDDAYSMRMPAWQAVRHEQNWLDAKRLGLTPVDVYATRDLVIVLESVQQVLDYQPDFEQIKSLNHHHAVILTAASGSGGYVLRNFVPNIGIDEDTATGSAQCSLAPYWLEKLGQEQLEVDQLSADGGYFRVSAAGEDILLTVKAEKKATVSLA
ncbi:PhzF family phenazine biosynthesis protein [Photobacterium galatheae]|uniref:Phenazine biosynthesis protein n=1 Tax=Photobacterium galatheae TaxID=1654360 RepID=A0A066RTV0_9GAMM|nr:PhzF family phenazine biosynthesis protein [Photobacterium galatheae]KDM91112.1 hypothetical protein EA58_13250 [Photobacterium galatheae]MCM0150166.1 PhzF family phenazine biosynthesis protein [Photobacterium galatheae]